MLGDDPRRYFDPRLITDEPLLKCDYPSAVERCAPPTTLKIPGRDSSHERELDHAVLVGAGRQELLNWKNALGNVVPVAWYARLCDRGDWDVLLQLQAAPERTGVSYYNYGPAYGGGEMVERHIAKHIARANRTNDRRIAVDVFGLEQFVRFRLADVRGVVVNACHRI